MGFMMEWRTAIICYRFPAISVVLELLMKLFFRHRLRSSPSIAASSCSGSSRASIRSATHGHGEYLNSTDKCWISFFETISLFSFLLLLSSQFLPGASAFFFRNLQLSPHLLNKFLRC